MDVTNASFFSDGRLNIALEINTEAAKWKNIGDE